VSFAQFREQTEAEITAVLERSAEKALLRVDSVQEGIQMLQRGEVSKKLAVRPKPLPGSTTVVEAKAADGELPALNQWGGQGLGKSPSSKARVPEGGVEEGSKAPVPKGKPGGKRGRGEDVAESSAKRPKPAGKRAAQPRTRSSAQVNLNDLPCDDS
jgi:hypothetical protein